MSAPQKIEVYCPECKALNGHFDSLEDAEKTYPNGCYYCNRGKGSQLGSDDFSEFLQQTQPELVKAFKTWKSKRVKFVDKQGNPHK